MSPVAHEFLDYQEVDVHFIFSFEWRPASPPESSFPYGVFTSGIKTSAKGAEKLHRLWRAPLIHERPIFEPNQPDDCGNEEHSQTTVSKQTLYSSYNPTFSVQRRTLAFEDALRGSSRAFVVVPFHHTETTLFPSARALYSLLSDNERDEFLWLLRDGTLVREQESLGDDNIITGALIRVHLFWAIRLFDTGTGTTTITVRRPKLAAFGQLLERAERYRLIHWLLHLSPNTDRHPEPWNLIDDVEPTDSFLLLTNLPTDVLDIIAPDDKMGLQHDSNGNTYVLTRLFDFGRAATKDAIAKFPRLKTEPASKKGAKRDSQAPDDVVIERQAGVGTVIRTSNDFLPDTTGFKPRHRQELSKWTPESAGDKDQSLPHEADAGLPNDSWKYCDQCWEENQTPFIVTSIVVSGPSMNELQDCISLRRAQEVAALLVKLTLGNNRITEDFIHLNPDYLRHYLPTTQDNRIVNMCLDDRVFFTMSRRGALAISPSDAGSGTQTSSKNCSSGRGPAYFVIPSLLNLCEILRTQIHAATSLNWELARLTISIASCDERNLEKVYMAYAELRRKLLLNLQNPINHLFDGGSVTEVAVAAKRLLMIDSAWEQAEKAFTAMDNYIRTSSSLWISSARMRT